MLLALTCVVLIQAFLILDLTRKASRQQNMIDGLTKTMKDQMGINARVNRALTRLSRRTKNNGDTK